MDTFDDIIIYGGGAVGLALSALIADAAVCPVRLVARGSTAERADRDGISVSGLRSGVRHIPVIFSGEPIGERSCVLVCTKAYSLKSVIADISGKASVWPPMVFLQNGFGILGQVQHLMQQSTIPVDHAKASRAIISIGAEKTGANAVTVHGLGELFLQQSRWSDDLRQMFVAAGIPCEVTTDIRGREAIKGVINSILNPLTALHDIPSGELWKLPGIEELVKVLIAEDVRILESQRILLSEQELFATLKKIIEATATNVSSMVQDVRAGRETEIEFFNGTLIAWAHDRGIPVPQNELLYQQLLAINTQKE